LQTRKTHRNPQKKKGLILVKLLIFKGPKGLVSFDFEGDYANIRNDFSLFDQRCFAAAINALCSFFVTKD